MSVLELIAQARHTAGAGPTWRVDVLLKELADALESQATQLLDAKRNERVVAEAGELKVELRLMTIAADVEAREADRNRAMVDKATAKLHTLEAAVRVVRDEGYIESEDDIMEVLEKLYALVPEVEA